MDMKFYLGSNLQRFSEKINNNAVSRLPSKDNFIDWVYDFISLVLWLVGAIAVFMLIYAGFKYIFSEGDSGKSENAKKTIISVTVALLIIMLSYIFVTWLLKPDSLFFNPTGQTGV